MRKTAALLIHCSVFFHALVMVVESFSFFEPPICWKCYNTNGRSILARVTAFEDEGMKGGSSINSNNMTSTISSIGVTEQPSRVITRNDDNTDATPSSTLEVLHKLLSPIDTRSIDQMTPAALAYIGDVVFELFVRCRYVWPNRRMSSLQDVVVNVVRAETQADLLANLTDSFELTNKELHILMRGRNAGGKKSGSRGSIYQDATALEALIGYTYISDPRRCADILRWMQRTLDEIDMEKSGGTSP